MRKRLAIAGHSAEGLALIPLLEANPDVEVCAVLTDDVDLARRELAALDPHLEERLGDALTSDADAVLRMPGLVAIVDAELGRSLRGTLDDAPDRGIQVTTPLIAKLLYAFGPVDASRKPDLLHTLAEILESYNLTVDRAGLLSRILQIAVGSTGADRGSLMLHDEERGELRVEVAIGIEKELIPKIRIRPGEGIAGRAFSDRRAVLITGKADHERYAITRERDDVESAISAPLIHDDRVLGVLNLAHSRRRAVFTEEDLEFVEQLARLDAKIITRAEEYHALLRDSARLRAQGAVREFLGETEPLPKRLSKACRFIAAELDGGICHIYLRDPELDVLILQGSSTQLDPLAAPLRIPLDDGIHGLVARTRESVVLSQPTDHACVCFAVLPLLARDELFGVLSFEGTHSGTQPEILREKICAAAQALSDELADALRELRMEREATKTTAITELAARMGSATDSADLFRTITSSSAMVLEAEHAILRIHDTASGRYQIRSYFGSADTESQPALFELEKQLSITAINQRGASRVVDIDNRPALAAFSAEITSAISLPLRRDGRVIGTLSVLEKVGQNPLAGEAFTAQDEALLARLGEHVQQAIEQTLERESLRHHQRFDELTGLPNATHLGERLEQEIARASGRGRTLALIRLRLDGLLDLPEDHQDSKVERLILSLAQELRAELREFDLVARTAIDTFEVLVPELEGDISALLGPLARRARDAIRREPDPAVFEQINLDFGYALFPDEGQTGRALLERARRPRITSA